MARVTDGTIDEKRLRRAMATVIADSVAEEDRPNRKNGAGVLVSAAVSVCAAGSAGEMVEAAAAILADRLLDAGTGDFVSPAFAGSCRRVSLAFVCFLEAAGLCTPPEADEALDLVGIDCHVSGSERRVLLACGPCILLHGSTGVKAARASDKSVLLCGRRVPHDGLRAAALEAGVAAGRFRDRVAHGDVLSGRPLRPQRPHLEGVVPLLLRDAYVRAFDAADDAVAGAYDRACRVAAAESPVTQLPAGWMSGIRSLIAAPPPGIRSSVVPTAVSDADFPRRALSLLADVFPAASDAPAAPDVVLRVSQAVGESPAQAVGRTRDAMRRHAAASAMQAGAGDESFVVRCAVIDAGVLRPLVVVGESGRIPPGVVLLCTRCRRVMAWLDLA